MFGIRAVGISRLTSIAAAVVAYTKSLVLSLKGDSAYNKNQNTTILDRSQNDLVVTRGGDAAQTVSSFSPFSSGASYYFDGTGDYLTVADAAALRMGSGDFTLEVYWYPTTISGYQTLFDKGYAASGSLVLQTGNGDGKINVYIGAAPPVIIAATAVTANTWNHIAVVRNSGTVTLYLNGVSVGSAANSTNINSTAQVGIGGAGSGVNGVGYYPITGYISNVRIVKGTALYTAAFTPPTTALTAVSGTSLLTCHSGRLFDASSNAADISVFGNITASTFSPFEKTALSGSVGSTSVYFDGAGDYLSVPSSTGFDFGTGDFTIECWARRTAAGSGDRFLVSRGNGANFVLRWNAAGNIQFYLNATVLVHNYTYAFPLNTWVHIAVTRSGSTSKLFINGTEVSSVANSTNAASTVNAVLVGGYTTSDWFAGNISNVRIVKGTAVYTAAFTPPTADITAVSGTSLLACQGSAISDSSSANATITVAGNCRLSTLNPYGAGSGWSGYFDGTGDYLSVARNAVFFPAANTDFTVEAWVFLTAAPGATNAQIIGTGEYGTDADWNLSVNSSLVVQSYIQSTNTVYTGGTITLNSWNHVAISRSGTGANNLKIFVNGVGTSYSMNGTLAGVGSRNLTIGADQNGDESNVTGYISNARIVNGSAVYTADFTPSTAALTAVSGTSLLTLQDNTFKDNSSNAFTVTPAGDVAIRAVGPFTASTLFPGSIYFDGANDYLTIPSTAAMNVLGSDLTIECWFNPTSFNASNYNYLIMQDDGGSDSQNFQLTCSAAGLVGFTTWNTSARASAFGLTSTRTVKLGAWNHIAVTHVKSTNTTRLFLNGVLEATSTTAMWAGSTQPTCIGNWNNGLGIQNSTYSKLNGYLSGVRLVKGSALYTAAFTPPTAPPTVTAGTALLLNFNDGGIIDGYGTNSSSTFANSGPFTDNVTKKYGSGSLYFNNNYLLSPQKAEYAFGTGDFTIQFWVNPTAQSASKGIMQITSTAPSSFAPTNEGVGIVLANGTAPFMLNFFIGGAAQTGTIGLTTGAWTHVALCRSAGTVRLFVGGVLSKSVASSANLTGQYLTVGAANGLAYGLPCYLDNIEIHKGYAKYTTNTTFTPE